jgi:hypothetical protein
MSLPLLLLLVASGPAGACWRALSGLISEPMSVSRSL